jgi:hypothetical protein
MIFPTSEVWCGGTSLRSVTRSTAEIVTSSGQSDTRWFMAPREKGGPVHGQILTVADWLRKPVFFDPCRRHPDGHPHEGRCAPDRHQNSAADSARGSGIVFNDHADEDGAIVFQHACKMGLEGIVSKRLSTPYRSGPSRDWIKIKNPDSPAMIRAHEGD